MSTDRLGRHVYRPRQYVIVLQENRTAYRVAKVERVLYKGPGYVVRFWRWDKGDWSGETTVIPGLILGVLQDGANRTESVAANLQALANMRANIIREADEEMLAAVAQLCNLKVT